MIFLFISFPLLGMIGMQEILVIALVVLILFGGKKIPELMRGLGAGMKSFKDGLRDGDAAASSDEKTSVPSKNDEKKDA